MQHIRKASWFVGNGVLIALVVSFSGLSGCISTTGTRYEAKKDESGLARTPLMLHELRSAYADASANESDMETRRKTLEASLSYFTADAYIPPNLPKPVRCPYSLTPVPKINDSVNWWFLLIPERMNWFVMRVNCSDGSVQKIPFGSFEREAVAFAKIWQVLARTPAKDPDEESRFAALAERYRSTADKPDLPESARRFKIAAETAVREKRLLDAVKAYDQALAVFPEWPQGRYNSALIYGEMLALEPAISQMERYLSLVPDAGNARAAQDKVYEWQSKLVSR